jgi:hypothetical protein
MLICEQDDFGRPLERESYAVTDSNDAQLIRTATGARKNHHLRLQREPNACYAMLPKRTSHGV